jgi:two-component system chemotaxis response regulator CheV
MIDDQYDFLDDDEIDLVELVSADTNSSNQYLIFVGSDDEVYGINVSKVRELLVYKDLHKVANNKPNSLIRATADIRGTMTAIVNFDEWFENKVLDDDQYELIILAGFGGYIFGIMIKSVEYIVNINPANMQDNTANDSKTNFITKIKLNGQDRLCTIFDGDKMLLDIFDDTNTKAKVEHLQAFNALDRSKYVLFADDSKFVRKLVQSLFDKLELKSKIYEDGALLLEGLKQMEPEEIGLIITDLEMPVMDGVTLMKTILDMRKYQDINIIVHTNMSNDIMTSNLTKIGAKEVIGKIDMLKLSDGIKKYFK